MTDCPTCPPPDEEWRRSRSWPWYDASNHGRLRSIDRLAQDSRGWTRRRVGRVLKLSTDRDGYKVHGLYREDGPPKQVYVHMLVLEEFGPPRPSPHHQALHGPGGNQDNHPANLYWGTPARNNGADKVRDGTSNHGERNGRAKLTAAQVAEIRTRYAAGGVTYRALAAEYRVGKAQVGSIIHRASWREVCV